jgi:hypothetical protein
MNLFSFPLSLLAPGPTASSTRTPPAPATKLHGIIIQSDAVSFLGKLFIRPAEALDLWFAGLLELGHLGMRWRTKVPLGMHAGIHVGLEDGRHFVVEQLAGGMRDLFTDGLHWTPLDEFEDRERKDLGGWDVTISPQQLREVDTVAEETAISRLNSIRGRPFLQEDCTGFIGRVFGPQRRMFADSAILRSLGFDMRSGEPALPLLSRQATLEIQSEWRLRADILRDLPDPAARSGSLSLRQLHERLFITGGVCVAAAVAGLVFHQRRSKPARRWHF